MFDGRTLHAREAVEILEENFGDLVFKTRIKKTIRYAEAPVKGASVLIYDTTGTAAEAYRELAKKVSSTARRTAPACVRVRSRSFPSNKFSPEAGRGAGSKAAADL